MAGTSHRDTETRRRPPVWNGTTATAVLISSLFWVGFFVTMGPRYATNDDPLLAMLASGTGFAAAPDEHLVFTNAAVGLGLRALYRAWPGVAWYPLYLLAAQVAAVTAIVFAVVRGGVSGARLGLLAVFLAVAAVPFANNLQFTVAAIVTGAAGLLLMLAALAQQRAGAGTLATAAALLALASLIRLEALALVLAIGTAPLVAAGWARPWADRRRIVLALAAAAAVALGAWAFDRAHDARDPAWSDYRAFNAALRPFVDFGRGAEYTPEAAVVFREAGWSRNDHRLLVQWFHPDAEVFGTESLRAVAARLPERADTPLARVREAAARVLGNRTALPILLAWPLALVACAGSRPGRQAMAAAVLSTLAVLAWLALFRKAPPHVFLPAIAWPVAVAAVLPGEAPARRATPVFFVFAAVLAAIAAARAMAFQRTETAEARAREAAYESALAPLRATPGQRFVLWSTFPYQVAGPFRASAAWPLERFVALGWPQRTPAAERALRALGFDDLWQALADPRTRLVAPVEAAGWIEQYARRHRAAVLTLAQESSVPGFGVFRASFAGEAGAGRVLRSGAAVPE